MGQRGFVKRITEALSRAIISGRFTFRVSKNNTQSDH